MQKGRAKQTFFKLHGAGNDLLIVDTRDLPRTGKAAFVRRLAHRQLGIGCDQLIEVLSLRPLAIQIWNQDGTRAEMCANGSRTFLFLAALKGWIPRAARHVPLQISGQPYEGLRTSPGNYELGLGIPEVGAIESLKLGKGRVLFTPVRTGNPHAVVWMAGAEGWKAPANFDFQAYGAAMETHARFPQKTNVEFLRSLKIKRSRAEAEVDAWERGAGATLSCGSGAVAVAALIRARYPEVKLVKVKMTDFRLQIRFEGHGAFLSGPCALVAEGRFFK